MSLSRWVRIQSDILDHPLFANAERSESDAWLWLIANAAWAQTHHRIGTEVVTVPVGSMFVTLRGLAKEWNWKSDKRVRTFLKTLENHEMIVTKTDAGKTQITICNYSKYQEDGRKQDAERTHDGRTKNTNTPNITSSLRSDVKANAPEKSSVKSELMRVLDEDHAQAVIEHRRAIKKAMTPHAAKLLAAKFAKCPNPNAAADVMIANGWQGFEPEWVANVASPRGHAPPGNQQPAMMADLTGALMRQMTDRRNDERDSENRSTIETSYSGGNHGTSAPAFRLTAPEGRR